MAELKIDTHQEAGRTQVSLSGEFDLAAINQFERALAEAEAGAVDVLVIDLTSVSFMDSSGLRALVMADDRARRAGRRLAIVAGPPQVRRVFEITQLDERLDLVESLAAV